MACRHSDAHGWHGPGRWRPSAVSQKAPYAFGAIASAALCVSALLSPFSLSDAFLVAVLAGILQQSLP